MALQAFTMYEDSWRVTTKHRPSHCSVGLLPWTVTWELLQCHLYARQPYVIMPLKFQYSWSRCYYYPQFRDDQKLNHLLRVLVFTGRTGIHPWLILNINTEGSSYPEEAREIRHGKEDWMRFFFKHFKASRIIKWADKNYTSGRKLCRGRTDSSSS